MGKVKYKVVARINPQDKEEEKRYYPCAKSMGEMTLEDMCKLIEKNCTLTSTDIMAVLNATDEVMREQLANSMIVRVGNLGHMRLSLSGKGAPDIIKTSEKISGCARAILAAPIAPMERPPM